MLNAGRSYIEHVRRRRSAIRQQQPFCATTDFSRLKEADAISFARSDAAASGANQTWSYSRDGYFIQPICRRDRSWCWSPRRTPNPGRIGAADSGKSGLRCPICDGGPGKRSNCCREFRAAFFRTAKIPGISSSFARARNGARGASASGRGRRVPLYAQGCGARWFR